MVAEGDTGEGTERTPDGSPSGRLSRRRLLRGSVAATPVLFTVVSSPVMGAGTGNCTAASAFASINASRPDALSTCSGMKPSWWAAPSNAKYWPSKYPSSMLFSSCLAAYSPCNGMSLLAVLKMNAPNGNNCVAQHMVAALLNAATNRTVGVLDEGTVKSIWSKFVAGGQYKYTPTPGITWYADSSSPANPNGGLTTWLKTTMVG